ncbi:hypothetical protein V8B97DRAFT_2025921 [Scleroderma yunnanense]
MGLYLGDMSFQDKVHWVCNGRADRLALVNPPESVGPILAVVQIDNNDFWLTADVNFHGLTEICLDYAVIKPSCVCHMPEAAPFTADWGSVTDNLHWLQDQIATPKFGMKQGLFVTAGKCVPQFKMHHVLFEALDIDELTMKEAASKEQSGKKENIEWKLIDPCCYHCHLEGALAEVHFNLSHWSISRNGVPGKDVYTADIRKVSAYLHPDASPMKCAKCS